MRRHFLRFKSYKALLFCATMMLVACKSTDPSDLSDLTACPDRRPEICSMQYQPVCAFNDQSRIVGSYGNRCGACTNAKVMGTVEGVCSKR